MDNAKRNRLLFALAAVVLLATGVVLVVPHLRGARPPADENGNEPAPVRPPEWVSCVPHNATLVFGTSDLPAMVGELGSGPLGKIAAGEGVKRFLLALEREPAGEFGELYEQIRLGLALSQCSAGEAFIAGWESKANGEPAIAAALHIKPDQMSEALRQVENVLKPPSVALRSVPAGPGQVCRTAAAQGSEGRAWGSFGEWLVVSGSVAGCREMLDSIAKPSAPKPDAPLFRALSSAGAGRLVGAADLRRVLTTEDCSFLGVETSGWVGYSASAGADGRWLERLTLGGKVLTDSGLVGALGSGGECPVLAGLPDSTLGSVTFNVADGARLWSLLRAKVAPGEGGVLGGALAKFSRATGKDFDRDVAGSLRGELTVGFMLQRQALYPQVLLGAGLTPGSGDKLSSSADAALMLLGNGGTVSSTDVSGARMAWLHGQSPSNPMCPLPCYSFQKDRLLAASSTVPLKEMLSGRGRPWVSEAEVRRTSAGLMGLRLDLRAAAPFMASILNDAGIRSRLPATAAGRLPAPEEIAEHLGRFEMVIGRSKSGLWAEMRGPMPLALLSVALGSGQE